mmetsp:Transcript_11509/g.48274  ORF Transcript_11509/g.48274 Transcript_11509/m.48274 type:complete len:325 (+) Transcript_11509:1058-2032(+)
MRQSTANGSLASASLLLSLCESSNEPRASSKASRAVPNLDEMGSLPRGFGPRKFATSFRTLIEAWTSGCIVCSPLSSSKPPQSETSLKHRASSLPLRCVAAARYNTRSTSSWRCADSARAASAARALLESASVSVVPRALLPSPWRLSTSSATIEFSSESFSASVARSSPWPTISDIPAAAAGSSCASALPRQHSRDANESTRSPRLRASIGGNWLRSSVPSDESARFRAATCCATFVDASSTASACRWRASAKPDRTSSRSLAFTAGGASGTVARGSFCALSPKATGSEQFDRRRHTGQGNSPISMPSAAAAAAGVEDSNEEQ